MDEQDGLLLADIRRHAEEAIRYLGKSSLKDFKADRRLQLQIERLVEIVGEAAGGLSEEARRSFDADWRGLRGLRNVLSHQYGSVDQSRLYETVKSYFPVLLDELGDL